MLAGNLEAPSLLGLRATVVSLDLECERVIPSNDGIQFDLEGLISSAIKMDPGLRRGDQR